MKNLKSMKCVSCGKKVTITFPYKIYVHEKNQKVPCADGFGYANPGEGGPGKVFGER